MIKTVYTSLKRVILIIILPAVSLADELEWKIEYALEFSASQLDALAEERLLSNNRFTDYTNTSGQWKIRNNSTWASGFIPGLFWMMYQHFGDDKWLDRARNWTDGVRSRATASDNDTGFQIFDSHGLGYFVTGKSNQDYLDVMRTGAETLFNQRFNPEIGCFRSWPQSKSNITDLPFEVNVDQMMNLELPLFIGINDDIQEYVDACISHADRTWEEIVREDGSTYHVASFNLDGSLDSRRTHQGWRAESTWSRGQAWATYGYTLVYRYTGLERMLDRAEKCFDYFIQAAEAQSEDLVPYSDFDAPLTSSHARDSSAAAILASAAIELYDLTGELKYISAARKILDALCNPGFLDASDGYESILRRACSRWGDPETGAVFGDYFFVEAMLRYRELFPLRVSPKRWSSQLTNISTRGTTGSGHLIMIAGFVIEGPGSSRVLIRGVGPTMAQHDINQYVNDPVIHVYRKEGDQSISLASNDNWESSPLRAETFEAVHLTGAFDLPIGSADAALVLTLDPGVYTVQMEKQNQADRAIGLIEIYILPSTQ